MKSPITGPLAASDVSAKEPAEVPIEPAGLVMVMLTEPLVPCTLLCCWLTLNGVGEARAGTESESNAAAAVAAASLKVRVITIRTPRLKLNLELVRSPEICRIARIEERKITGFQKDTTSG